MATDSNPNNDINTDIENALYELAEHGNAIEIYRDFDIYKHIYTHVGTYYTIELHFKWYKYLDPTAKSSLLDFTGDDKGIIKPMHEAYDQSVWPTDAEMVQEELVRGHGGGGLLHLMVMVKPL